MKFFKFSLLLFAIAVLPLCAQTTTLQIKLYGTDRMEHTKVRYICDASAAKLKLPSGPFTVEYIRGAGNTLAVVPVEGNSLIFASAVSGSGFRYTSGWYTWQGKGSEATLTRLVNDRADDPSTTCHQVSSRRPGAPSSRRFYRR